MNFKKLEVYGFKSFADKLSVEFSDGITAIVGPNGCGKSNVADAIRWALGEQSARTLRGASMADVIFNGTDARKSLSFCEVLLHFDNTARIFDTEYDEVVISRKLYRDGTSEYGLNKQQCRLKDIHAILFNSGLGRDSYSIIGQGRIDEILSAKPDDRRLIFEDAAGISKYKQSKLENERRLLRVEESLAITNTTVNELERQLGPLKKQAEDARLYFELKDKLRHLEVNAYLRDHDSSEADRKKFADRIAGIEDEITFRHGEYNAVCMTYSETLDSMNSADEKLRDLNNNLLDLTVRLEKQAGQVMLVQNRIEYLVEQNIRMKGENEEYAHEAAAARDELAALRAGREGTTAELNALKAELNKQTDAYTAAAQSLAKSEGDAEDKNRRVIEAMARLSDVKADMSKLTAERAAAAERRADIAARAAALKKTLAETEAFLGAAAEQKKAELEELQALRAHSDSLTNKYNEALSALGAAAAELDKTAAAYHTAAARKKMLAEIQNEMQGYAVSVKRLVSDARADRELAARIEGVVAQLVKTDAKFETAVEIALGAALQNIVTKDEDAAKYLIAYLKDKKYGRATFLPMTAVKARELEPHHAQFIKERGVYGIASKLIEFDPKYADIFSNLLGRTLIVEDIDIAVSIARRAAYAFRIVTLDGDMINPQGSISGGSRRAEISGMLGAERELEEIAALAAQLKTRMDKLAEKQAKLGGERDELLKQIREASRKSADLGAVYSAHEADGAALERGQERDGAALKSLVSEDAGLAAREKEIEARLRSVDELEAVIASGKQTMDAGKEEDRRQFAIDKAELDRLAAAMTESKVAIAAAAAAAEGAESDIGRVTAEIARLEAAAAENRAEIEKNDVQIKTIEQSVTADEDSADTARLRAFVAAVREEIDKITAFKQICAGDVAELDKKRSELVTAVNGLNQRKFEQEKALERVNLNLETAQDRILREYNLTVDDCERYRDPGFDASGAKPEINRIGREIAKMGYINGNAPEDYDKVK
ncbi:MAG: chromosome segregation protein SMC, partial [Firmicutes bacterium]|nr:chromosome segregation protein SMC [Bacillota bacterium]